MSNSFVRRVRTVALPLLSLALLPMAAEAQTLREQTSPRQRDPIAAGPSQIISINPFMPLLGYFQAEYEKRLQDNLSFALAGSYTRLDDYYTNIDAKLRLYPNEMALEGIGVAAGIGYGSIRRNDEVCDSFTFDSCTRDRKTSSAPTFSVEAQYQWMLGSRRSTAVTMGAGVKRYFISDEDSGGISRVVPTLRLTIGYAWR